MIARPFIGKPGAFVRTPGRRDYSLPPPEPTVLDVLVEHGVHVDGVGKIPDIFAGRGISRSIPARGNEETVDQVLALLKERSGKRLIFANCVDFDSVWGHRNDVEGFARGLEAFDARLPEILNALGERDVLFIVADHGCDPTTPSTDHSREMTPLLVAGPPVLPGINLGTRESFSDVAATIAEAFNVPAPRRGTSFYRDVIGPDF